jgi:hypothetical protein
MPGPSDDIPRWQPPEPSDDAPRWVPPPPSSDVPRWEPPAAPVDTTPPPKRPRPRRESAPQRAPERLPSRAPARAATLPTRPLNWWGRHPWALVWALVILAPLTVILLRVLDDSGYDRLLVPLAWGMVALLLMALAVAVPPTARRSVPGAVLGLATVLVVLSVLLWSATRVTLGHTECPERAGVDRGGPVAVSLLEAWKHGKAGDAGWHDAAAAGLWRDRIDVMRLIDYQLIDSGCWERLAPVDVTRTWHEFRVRIEARERQPLSKVIVVHTESKRGDWKIRSVEGPMP